MGFGDVGDLEMILPGYFEVGVYIPFGVDHNRLPGLLASNDITVLGETLVGDMFEVHRGSMVDG